MVMWRLLPRSSRTPRRHPAADRLEFIASVTDPIAYYLILAVRTSRQCSLPRRTGMVWRGLGNGNVRSAGPVISPTALSASFTPLALSPAKSGTGVRTE
jgi:hypothetical protein